MATLNIENSFITENRSVYDYLNQSGQGLYIPLYQRDYSWDTDNIDQLLEDLSRGIQRIARGEVSDDSKEIRFLGTIIIVLENNKNNLYPVDLQGVPSRVEKLIDGQQRISTIALMATLLLKRLYEIRKKFKNRAIYDQIDDVYGLWTEKLLSLFSLDLRRGNPTRKPKIIRGSKDYWTRNHEVDTAYPSELANYLAHFIQAQVEDAQFPSLNSTREKYGNTLLYQNGKRIETWLNKVVATAHCDDASDEFPSAKLIIETISQEYLWDFERPGIKEIIQVQDVSDKRSDAYLLCELVQTLAVCHYLLDRCCFTIIQPTDDDWAFDMFQSLNASGTPLTAIETFKPLIVNTMNGAAGYTGYKGSKSDQAFSILDAFLSETNTAQQKSKRTNDFLTSFFVAFDGRTLSSHFSQQRKALDDAYDSCPTIADKENLIVKMGNYADFYNKWLKYTSGLFPKTESDINNADITALIISFLKSCNHKMAITILGTMYDKILDGQEDAVTNFIKSVKAIGAYYFLWRSALPNTGLDASYREFFKKLEGEECTIEKVREFAVQNLAKKGINNREAWIEEAKGRLKYKDSSNELIRFALLVAADDTTNDPENPGLIIEGRTGCSEFLTLEKWLSPHLKTIEHVAPQSNSGAWDEKLYDSQLKHFNALGNLTLLPQDLNSSVGNKDFKEKLFYYKAVAAKEQHKVEQLKQAAAEEEITLNDNAIAMLKDSEYNAHLSSIASLPSDFVWDKEFVEKRTERLLGIIWDKIHSWVFRDRM